MVEDQRAMGGGSPMSGQTNVLEATFESITDGVIIYDRDGRIVQVNAAARELIGLDARPDYASLALEDRLSLFAVYNERGQPLPREQWPVSRILKGEVLKGAQALEVAMHTLDGRKVQVSIGGAPVRDQEGRIVGAVAVARVTERYRLERRTREVLDGLLVMAGAVVEIPTDSDTQAEVLPAARRASSSRLRSVGQQLVELTRSILGCQLVTITIVEPRMNEEYSLAAVGLTPEQEQAWQSRQPGAHVSEQIAHSPLADRLVREGWLIFDVSHTPFEAELGMVGIHEMFLAPMYVGHELIGILTLAFRGEHTYLPDEIDFARAVAKLTALVIERERLLYERAESQANELALRAVNRRMDDFLGIASHEIRTPLTTIKANIQLARRRLKSALQDKTVLTGELVGSLSLANELLARADRQVSMLNRLVGDLLDVSRIEVGRFELHLVPALCDLREIVLEGVQEQRQVVPERHIRLYPLPAEPVFVRVDADRIGQVISNYLTNALKYSASDRPVDVSLQVDRSVARVAVHDDGPGLPSEEQEQIWERFYRAPGVEVQSGSGIGLGLGLHISRMIIEWHHGQVGVQSEPGKGSTFWFTLHLAQEAEVSGAADPEYG